MSKRFGYFLWKNQGYFGKAILLHDISYVKVFFMILNIIFLNSKIVQNSLNSQSYLLRKNENRQSPDGFKG
jgi:hypothetical protein